MCLLYNWENNGHAQQVAHKVRRVPGLGFTCVMETPAELNGFSGAPIVDQNGLLVGILTVDMNSPGYARIFTGHLISELMPVLKEARAVKGMATLTPIRPANKTPVQTGNTSNLKLAGDTI